MQRTRVAVGQETIELENRLARDWRVTRRTGLRIPRPMAEAARTTWTGIRSPGWCGAAPPDAGPADRSLRPGPGTRRRSAPGPHGRLGEVTSPAGSGTGSAPDRSWRLTRIMASAMITASTRMPAETR